MIKFNNVTKTYLGHKALLNLNLHIEKGEMAFLTGHSGAGKSTLLKLIMMMERCSQGRIHIDNQNISRLPSRGIAKMRRNIGMILQDPYLISTRTVFENVGLPLVIAGYNQQEIGKRVRAALDKVGLLTKEKSYPLNLSSGEQQRISIARAVVHTPSILLADEPTGNLDPKLSREIMSLFREFNDVGTTVLIATHDLPLIASLPYRIMTIKSGQLISDSKHE